MDQALYIQIVFLAFAAAELALGRFLQRENTTAGDVPLELISTLVLPGVIVPAIFLTAPALLEALQPGSAGLLAGLPWFALVALFLVGDDMTQYWWHRLSHRLPWLYGLHRAHHEARYMSVRLVYRNNLLYYAMMPGLWISAALVHLGAARAELVYLAYVCVKMTVVIAAHSNVRWDLPLYRLAERSRPVDRLMWVIERTISTPATHSAHHGLHAADGITHYKGNFGNLLFFWDVLFGSAHITRKAPAAYGIEHLVPVSWTRNLLFPAYPRFEDRDEETAQKEDDGKWMAPERGLGFFARRGLGLPLSLNGDGPGDARPLLEDLERAL
jgi:sterol desaturase/sphingolipid hydroxylase (fatty acid hydroxylase superfamily)